MPEGQLRELLSGIYADEVGHARFGWRVVGELVPQLDIDARHPTPDGLPIDAADA